VEGQEDHAPRHALRHPRPGGDRAAALTCTPSTSDSRSSNGSWEPLQAVYARACLPAVEAALTRGDRRKISFLPDVRVCTVEADVLRGLDPRGLTFFNINTPEDLARAESLLAEG
jgi:molybdopterin-guanine dinucleotide biosynthesis protein A